MFNKFDEVSLLLEDYKRKIPLGDMDITQLRMKIHEDFQKLDSALELLNDPECKSKSGHEKLISYFENNVGTPLTGSQLSQIYDGGCGGDWSRSIRKLRTEEGYDISTSKSDPRLAKGVYVLNTMERVEPHDRNIDDVTKSQALARDGYCCQKCKISIDKLHPALPQKRFEWHHIVPAEIRGGKELENVATLCNCCHVACHKYMKDGDLISLDPAEIKAAFSTWLLGETGHSHNETRSDQFDLFGS